MKVLRYLTLSLFVIFGLFFVSILVPGIYYGVQDGYISEIGPFVSIYGLCLAACVFGAIRCVPQRSPQV